MVLGLRAYKVVVDDTYCMFQRRSGQLSPDLTYHLDERGA
jgi:hypothetical protein